MEQSDRLATHSPAPPNLTHPLHCTHDARAPLARRRLVTHRYARPPAVASPARYGKTAVLRGCLTPLGGAGVYCSLLLPLSLPSLLLLLLLGPGSGGAAIPVNAQPDLQLRP